MEVEKVWERHLRQTVHRPSVKPLGRSVVFTEGQFGKGPSHLSCCCVETGREEWSAVVSDPWGWTDTFEDEVYYLSRSGHLTVINALTGSSLMDSALPGRFLGYVVPTENTIVTGGWRGYTNLVGLDRDTLELKWEVNYKSPEIQRFAIPMALPSGMLLVAHHSKGVVEIREADSGIIVAQTAISREFTCSDLERSFQAVGGVPTALSGKGLQLTIDPSSYESHFKQLNIQHSNTVRPKFDETRIVYSDGVGNASLYDRKQDRDIWKVQIESNLRDQIFAAFIGERHTLLAGPLGQLKVLDSEGVEVGRAPSFRRVVTNLMEEGQSVVFCGKCEIIGLRWSE